MISREARMHLISEVNHPCSFAFLVSQILDRFERKAIKYHKIVIFVYFSTYLIFVIFLTLALFEA